MTHTPTPTQTPPRIGCRFHSVLPPPPPLASRFGATAGVLAGHRRVAMHHATTPPRRSQKGGTHSARAPSVLPHSDRQIERSSGTPYGSASGALASHSASNPLWSLHTGKTFFQQKVTLHQCRLTFLLTFTRFCDLLQIIELAKCCLLHQLHIQASQHQGRI